MYFGGYVRRLNEKELACLLCYVAGSSSLAVETIKVIFHVQVGNLPHVSVHACSGIVDLPSSGYESFPECWRNYISSQHKSYQIYYSFRLKYIDEPAF